MLYALMGLGLSLITGVLNIPNFAHGALFAIGAYFLVSVVGVVGNFWLGLLIAPLGVALLGLAIEWAGVRRLYSAGHDYQLLFTFGLALILNELIIVIWGPVGISRSEEHTSELQSRRDLVCRLLLEKKNKKQKDINN